MATALIVVDVQVDFCEGGSLAVDGGTDVARRITQYAAAHAGEYPVVVATRDWHVAPGRHFSDHPDYIDTWPVHCVAGTPGAAFHPALDLDDPTVVSKGADQAAYSGFEGFDDKGRSLRDILDEFGIDAADVVGLATDYCVRATALDAVRSGLGVRVLVDLCAGVAPASTEAALNELAEAGVVLASGLALGLGLGLALALGLGLGLGLGPG